LSDADDADLGITVLRGAIVVGSCGGADSGSNDRGGFLAGENARPPFPLAPAAARAAAALAAAASASCTEAGADMLFIELR